ncbi:MAG: hypothetical protein AVDCRST_MAG68-4718 [uncultured Gemmatimonadetes bacterium]|uniref:Uncharacterized protein n=1 Tax=uncultured Gemmatimonadota bacterium TaxID=203437 RepID=A0A6J4MQY4_9BACT|nr:MAG: hypothetical protein AVDCRST_MAG68-4718 [uncultured Gemmatimonadota bacterium]
MEALIGAEQEVGQQPNRPTTEQFSKVPHVIAGTLVYPKLVRKAARVKPD